jgi:alpha/beta superfamily hydrolase
VSEEPSTPRPYVRPLVQRLAIPGPDGPLEAVAETPVGFDGARAAVICHPHPLHGGTMDNKVVTITARAMQEAGVATVRFNFRGVGASGGSFDDARGETEDALAVARWAEARWPGARLLVAGFSFGAYVAYRVAGLRAVERLITIAPPVRRFDFDFEAQPRPAAPWFVIQGDRDELVDVQAVREWTARASPPPTLTVLEGAEHFFHGRLNELRAAVTASLTG